MTIKTIKFRKGMTLIEIVIASTILMIVLSTVMATYAGFTSSKRKLLLASEVYNETRFLSERIVREIHNGTIDYQGYWRENIKNESAENWIYETDPNSNIYEGSNPKGAKIDQTFADVSDDGNHWGLNSQKNCNSPAPYSDPEEDVNDTNSTKKRDDIIFNYRYQFIYPGGWTAEDNTPTDSMVHLNCFDDDFDDTDTGSYYNIYDDESAYGRGPRAFNQSGIYTASINAVKASEMLWDWDLTDNGGTPNPTLNNNPPLLLVKSNEDNTEYTRTALRYTDNKIKLLQFIGKDTDVSPPDFIPDEWKCKTDFKCNDAYDGSYIWSQKETSGDGVGTITDSKLTWKDITPEKIEIIDFEFILSPVKDPKRAFYEEERIQKPQVTLILEARAKDSAMKGIKGTAPSIRIQTTATPRIWDLIEVDN